MTLIAVDTSVLIGFFRGRPTAATERLTRLESEGVPFAIPGLCCQELLQGAKDEREWKVLKAYLESQALLFPSDPWATHVGAARIYFDCRRRGLTVRSTVDCLVAQLALEHDSELLHDDADFDAIARVRPLRAIRG